MFRRKRLLRLLAVFVILLGLRRLALRSSRRTNEPPQPVGTDAEVAKLIGEILDKACQNWLDNTGYVTPLASLRHVMATELDLPWVTATVIADQLEDDLEEKLRARGVDIDAEIVERRHQSETA